MSKPILRIFTWTLLLGSAAGAIIAGVTVGELEAFSRPLVLTLQPGPIANWSLFFLSISIGFCVYLLRGIESGRWSLTVKGILAVSAAALVVLVFGTVGLLMLGTVSIFAAPILIRRKSTQSDT